MLVLLIIFMVAAPLMAAGIPLICQRRKRTHWSIKKQPIAVTIDAEGKFFVDQREVAADELILVLSESADRQGAPHSCARR